MKLGDMCKIRKQIDIGSGIVMPISLIWYICFYVMVAIGNRYVFIYLLYYEIHT